MQFSSNFFAQQLPPGLFGQRKERFSWKSSWFLLKCPFLPILSRQGLEMAVDSSTMLQSSINLKISSFYEIITLESWFCVKIF